MELGSVTTLASKLLAALEKSGISSGAELRSTLGPSGPPAQDLIRAFEDALNKGPEAITGDAAGMTEPHEVRGVDQIPSGNLSADNVSMDGTAQEMPAPTTIEKPATSLTDNDHVPTGQDRQPGSEPLRELENIMNRIDSGQLRAEDLFRMQYLIGMLKVQTESGMQASRKTAQGFDNLLKQQG